MPIKIGHYYYAFGYPMLAVSDTWRQTSIRLVPYSNTLGGLLLRRSDMVSMNNATGPIPLDWQPAEVVVGKRSSQGYLMRALRHPTTGEILVTAGCRVERGFMAFHRMLAKTSDGRSLELQAELFLNLASLRYVCRDRNWL